MNRAVMILALALFGQPVLAQPADAPAEPAAQPGERKAKTKAKAKTKTKAKAKAEGEDADGEAAEGVPPAVEAAERAAPAPAEAGGPGAVPPGSPARAPTPTPEPAEPMVPTPTPTPAPIKPPAQPTLDEGFGDLPSFDDLDPAADPATLGGGMKANWDAAAGPEAQVSFPWVEHHGYFRLRTDLFYNFDLDTHVGSAPGQRSSSIDPPLSELDDVGTPGHPEDFRDNEDTGTFARDADSLASANIRFRYQPTLHISEALRVRGTFDILDNLVLGSTADGSPRSLFARPDVELPFFSDTQRSPSAGVDGWRDAIRVKNLWGEWHTPLGLLAFGRMQAHWGLGMLVNGGQCLDCDFGDNVDRIMATTQLFDTYLSVSWDFPVEGAVGMGGVGTTRTEAGGQPYDLDNRDDVNQWTVAIYRKPYALEEKERRARALDELREPVLDGGLYAIFRTQTLESDSELGGLPEDGGYTLYEIDAWSITPDLWLDFQYRPSPDSAIRIQAEAAMVIGEIAELPMHAGQPQPGCPTVVAPGEQCPDPYDTRRRDILRYGYALEIDGRYKSLNIGLHHGLASGDDQEGFGVRDTERLSADNFEDFDSTLGLFRFDRDYHVDHILFREVIGAVANATYFKPYIGYDLVDESDEAWGFELSALYAFALEKNATPGNAPNLGLEMGLEIYIHEFDRFRWALNYSALFPFDGLSITVDGRRYDPGIAQTVQMFLGMEF